MDSDHPAFRARLTAQAEELIGALAHAEKTILATIERECEALRTGRMLAAKSLHNRLQETTELYLNCARAARASMDTLEVVLPGCREYLERRRAAFAPVLQIELAVLGAQRAAADTAIAERSYAESRARETAGRGPALTRPAGVQSVDAPLRAENPGPARRIHGPLSLPSSPAAPPRRRAV